MLSSLLFGLYLWSASGLRMILNQFLAVMGLRAPYLRLYYFVTMDEADDTINWGVSSPLWGLGFSTVLGAGHDHLGDTKQLG